MVSKLVFEQNFINDYRYSQYCLESKETIRLAKVNCTYRMQSRRLSLVDMVLKCGPLVLSH